MFAKLFGPPDDQVLATFTEGDDGPELKVYANPGGILGVSEVTIAYHDDKRDEARKVFEELDEAGARKIAASLYEAAAAFGA